MAQRTLLKTFHLANPLYIGSLVTCWAIDSAGAKTTTKITLYANETGATSSDQLANPQTLDSDGKLKQPVYYDAPFIASVAGVSIADYDTGINYTVGTYRGTWVTATVYYPGDTVREPASLKDIYVINTRHTSGTFATDVANLDLEVMIAATAAVGLVDDQWQNSLAATYVSATTFTLVGDQTTEYHTGRRIKNTGGADRYSDVKSSAFTSLTTVTVINTTDTAGAPATLHASMSTAETSILSSNPLSANKNHWPLAAGESGVIKYYEYKNGDTRRFGTIGDGVADDTVALQAAFDWMAAAKGRCLNMPPGDYLVTAKLTLISTTWHHDLSAYGARINSTATDVVLQMGSGTDGWEYSWIRGLSLYGNLANTVLWLTGQDCLSSRYEDMYIEGNRASPASVDHCLLIEGNKTYFNSFHRTRFVGAVALVSINYNHTTSTENAATYTSNASKFLMCESFAAGSYGLYIHGSVGNEVHAGEFTNSPGSLYDVYLAKDSSGKVSKANYIQGRFESSAANEIYVGDSCILNLFILLVQSTMIYQTAADKLENTEIEVGSNNGILVGPISVDTLSPLDGTTLDIVMTSGRIQFTGDIFAPRASETNTFDIGAATKLWKDIFYGGAIYHSTTNNITAFAGGGQSSAAELSSYFNEVDTIATAGDSVKLADQVNSQITVFNNHASNALDVFPHVGGNLDAGSANAAVSLAAGARITYYLRDTTNWHSI